MSLETWKKEFYPKEPSKRMSKVQAIQHSLTKWIGLLPENLTKHEVYLEEKKLTEFYGYDDFWVTSYSCALCVKYLDSESETQHECHKCPLYKSLGGYSCDGNDDMPYIKFVDTGNPEPMIAALEKTLLENKK